MEDKDGQLITGVDLGGSGADHTAIALIKCGCFMIISKQDVISIAKELGLVVYEKGSKL